ncbi:hypothetical protein SRHO_G00291370 [Serrasalmus rhombeus]
MMTQNKDYVDLEELETRSQVSSCSRTSKLSVASSLALKARAKAEAIRAELAFAKQEAEMLKQQAIIQANLHELRMEKAAAAAQAEGEILEAAAEEYEQTSPPQQRNSIMLPQTPAELHGENAAVQMPVQQPGHQFYQSVTANTLHSFTAPLPDAKPPMTSHSPVCQPTMDSGVQSYRNQGDMPSSEVSDHEFIELAPHHSSRGQTTWTSQQHTSTRQNKPYSSREPPLNMNHIGNEYKPPQPYQTHSFPMYTNPSSPAATSDLGKYLMRRELRLYLHTETSQSLKIKTGMQSYNENLISHLQCPKISFCLVSKHFRKGGPHPAASSLVSPPCSKDTAVAMEIRWFKGTDCVCLYKKRQETEGRGYKGRVSLFTQELQRGNVSLQIRECKWSDEGDYLCQVTSRDTTKECTVGMWSSKYSRSSLYTNSTSSSVSHLRMKDEKTEMRMLMCSDKGGKTYRG